MCRISSVGKCMDEGKCVLDNNKHMKQRKKRDVAGGRERETLSRPALIRWSSPKPSWCFSLMTPLLLLLLLLLLLWVWLLLSWLTLVLHISGSDNMMDKFTLAAVQVIMPVSIAAGNGTLFLWYSAYDWYVYYS